jgi:peroxiredoxin
MMDFEERYYDLKRRHADVFGVQPGAEETEDEFLKRLPLREKLADDVFELASEYVKSELEKSGKPLDIVLYPAYILDTFEESETPEYLFTYLRDVIKYEDIIEGSVVERVNRMR